MLNFGQFKESMDVAIGKDGLKNTWQAPFPETTLCVHCKGEARIAFVAKEGSEKGEKNPEFVFCLYKNDPKGKGFWPHDAGAFSLQ